MIRGTLTICLIALTIAAIEVERDLHKAFLKGIF